MKTKEEIAKYLESHKVELFDLITIQGYLHVKGIDVNSIVGDGKILTAKTFIEWFERETKEDNYNIMTYEVSDSFKREYFPKEKQPKEENQDIITFEGKEYEFIESTWGNCCINCDLRELDNCTLSPRICCSDNRRDRKEGYFKLIKPKDILVPECIKIVKGCDGKLGLLFNERKQVITSFNVSDTIFDLNSFDTLFHKIIPCKLVPVHDDDIKIGEIFFCCKIEYVNTDESVNYTDLANITDQRHYVIKVTDENGVSIQDEGCSIRIHGIDTGAVVYKVIPLK